MIVLVFSVGGIPKKNRILLTLELGKADKEIGTVADPVKR
jgi:hypothetical protein